MMEQSTWCDISKKNSIMTTPKKKPSKAFKSEKKNASFSNSRMELLASCQSCRFAICAMLPSPGQVKCPTNSAAILPAVRFKTVTAAKLPQPFPKVSWKMASLPFSPVITARKWLTRNSISRTSDCYFVWLRASQVGNVTRAEDITPSLSESDRNRHFLANQPSSRVQHHRSWTRPLWITG